MNKNTSKYQSKSRSKSKNKENNNNQMIKTKTILNEPPKNSSRRPKPKRNAYMFFALAMRDKIEEELQKKQHNLVTGKEVTTELSSRYKQLKISEIKKYLDLENKDRLRWEKQNEDFETKGFWIEKDDDNDKNNSNKSNKHDKFEVTETSFLTKKKKSSGSLNKNKNINKSATKSSTKSATKSINKSVKSNKKKSEKKKTKEESSDDEIEIKASSNTGSKVVRKDTNIVINQNVLVQGHEYVNVYDIYKFVSLLGEGSFGTVEKVIHKKTGIVRALKRINKRNQISTELEIKNEIEILKKLDHPNIVKIFEFYNSTENYYIVTEFCKDGELFDYLAKNGAFKEDQVAYIAYQILSAVYFCHSSNILHRDLKPENILIESINKNGYLDVKLIDFGIAKIFEKNKTENEIVGTSYYMAPEVLNGGHSEKCDLWSIGVIIYVLLNNQVPFEGDELEDIYKNIRKGVYKIKGTALQSCSPEIKDIIAQLLEMNPNKRLTAQKALNHEWFTKMGIKDILFETAKLNIKTNLNKFANYKKGFKLQQAAIAFIVHNMPPNDEIRNIYSTFKMLDENGDGRITKKELLKGLKLHNPTLDITKDTIDYIFNSIDSDKNGYLEYEEFTRVLIDKKNLMTNEILKFAFNFFDNDGSGDITREELEDIFGNINSDKLEKLIAEVDTDGNGKISFKEFKTMMCKIISE